MVLDDKDYVSVYNEGGLQIQRINYIWISCNNYRIEGNFEKWRWLLDAIWSELSFDIFKLGKSKHLKDWEENEYVKVMNDLDFKIDMASKMKNKSAIYYLLNKKEIYLRILQNKVDKGGKYDDSREDRMD